VEHVDGAGFEARVVDARHATDLEVEVADGDGPGEGGRVADHQAAGSDVASGGRERAGRDLGADPVGVAHRDGKNRGVVHGVAFRSVMAWRRSASIQVTAAITSPIRPPLVTTRRPAWGPPTTRPVTASGRTSSSIAMPEPPRAASTPTVTSPPVR